MITAKLEAIKNAICLRCLHICKKFEFLISYGNVTTTKVLSHGFGRKISCAFQQCKLFENRLRFDKVTESLKVGPV